MSVGTRKKIVDFQRMIDDKVAIANIRFFMKNTMLIKRMIKIKIKIF